MLRRAAREGRPPGSRAGSADSPAACGCSPRTQSRPQSRPRRGWSAVTQPPRRQRWYEDPANAVLLQHADFATARAVVEFGCGTGRLAARLLRDHLPDQATYVGFDLSRTMVGLARSRIAAWTDRATVRLTEGSPALPVATATADRFLSTYVLDLLSEADIAATLREARRVLAPGGRLCLASLTFGRTLPSHVVCGLWRALHALSPRLVGGCRPLRLERLAGPEWQARHRETVCRYGLCAEVLVAT